MPRQFREGPSNLNSQAASQEYSSAVFERASEIFALLGTCDAMRSILASHGWYRR